MLKILKPFLPLPGLGLLAIIFFGKSDMIPWEKVNLFWLMAWIPLTTLCLWGVYRLGSWRGSGSPSREKSR